MSKFVYTLLMKIHLLLIGTELLQGKIIDAQTHWFGQFLTERSLKLESVHIISDSPTLILETMKKLSTADRLIISGGLGPTLDDLTKKILADFLQVPLHFSSQAKTIVEGNYSRQNRPAPPPQHGYYFLPKNVLALNNPTGFAPGLRSSSSQGEIICLPGVPHEFQSIIKENADELFPRPAAFFKLLNFRTQGIPEEKIFTELCPTLWQDLEKWGEVVSLPHVMAVDVGVKIAATNKSELEQKEKECTDFILSSPLKKHLWHIGQESLEKVIIDEARKRNLKIAFAESCTGGLNTHRLTNISGSSDVLWGGIVSYANDFKKQFLDVEENLLTSFGAVSSECAMAMAQNLRLKSNVDFVLSTTGIAGPGGGSEQKPVGTVWIGLSSKKETISTQYQFKGNRELLKLRFSQAGLFLLLKKIIEI